MKEKPSYKVMKTKARPEPNGQTEAAGRTRSITVMLRGFQKDQWNPSFVKSLLWHHSLAFPAKSTVHIFSEKNVYLLIFMWVWICTYEYHMHAGA